jgi:hypothetical protein
MIRFALTRATVISLMLGLAAPAMAGDMQGTPQRGKRQIPAVVVNPYAEPSLPIENALRWGYSQGYQHYPSGFGGLRRRPLPGQHDRKQELSHLVVNSDLCWLGQQMIFVTRGN